MNYVNDPIFKELTEKHPHTLDALAGIAADLGMPYTFLLHELCEAYRFQRQAEEVAGE
jgi:hypothetical protein